MELQRVRHDWVTGQQQQKAMCVSQPENPGLQLCFNWLWLWVIFIWKVSKILELSRRWTWRNFKHYTGLWASVYANTHVYMHTWKLRGGCSQQLLVWPGTLMPLGNSYLQLHPVVWNGCQSEDLILCSNQDWKVTQDDHNSVLVGTRYVSIHRKPNKHAFERRKTKGCW